MHSRWKPEREAEEEEEEEEEEAEAEAEGEWEWEWEWGRERGEDGGKVKSAEEQAKTHSKRTKEQDGTSTNQENKQEQHLPIRHAGRPVD